MLLAETYTIGDLSHVYPLMRGVRPLLVPLIAVLVLGERLSDLEWLGVSCSNGDMAHWKMAYKAIHGWFDSSDKGT